MYKYNVKYSKTAQKRTAKCRPQLLCEQKSDSNHFVLDILLVFVKLKADGFRAVRIA